MSAVLATLATPPAPARPNILALAFDDLRPWFLPFQDSSIAAPSFLRLAKGALAFNHTYVQQAVCSPSRNSFMSGRRPDSTRVYNFKTSFRESGVDASGKPGSEWVALPQAFKQAGYLTVGMGKLYHPGHPNNNDCSHPEKAGGCPSWTTTFNTTAPANVTLENHGEHPVLVGCRAAFEAVVEGQEK